MQRASMHAWNLSTACYAGESWHRPQHCCTPTHNWRLNDAGTEALSYCIAVVKDGRIVKDGILSQVIRMATEFDTAAGETLLNMGADSKASQQRSADSCVFTQGCICGICGV